MVKLIYGKQYPIVSKRAKRLVKSILGGDMDEFNYVRMNGQENLVQDVVEECSFASWGGVKIIRVDDPYYLGSQKEKIAIEKEQDYAKLVDYIKNDRAEDILLLFVLHGDANKKSDVYRAIEKHGEIIYEEGLSIDSLKVTGQQYFAKKGCSIDADALDLLIERIGEDVALFISEAEKLCLYSKHITVDDVHVMVPVPLELNTFAICDNLIHNNIAEAIKIYRDLLVMKEEPVLLLNLFASTFRTKTEIAHLYLNERYDQEHIAKELGIHPYRVKLACREFNNLSYEALTSIMEYLYETDTKVKGMEIDPTVALELFMVHFNDIKKGNF